MMLELLPLMNIAPPAVVIDEESTTLFAKSCVASFPVNIELDIVELYPSMLHAPPFTALLLVKVELLIWTFKPFSSTAPPETA